YRDRNDRMRGEGTRNLLAAAVAAGAARVIAQSISWELPSEHHRAVTAGHERAVLQAGGVVIRYGQLWGPGTYYPAAPPNPPPNPRPAPTPTPPPARPCSHLRRHPA